MKADSAMNKKTKAPVAAAGAKKPVREGVAYLIESELEKAGLVLAAKAIPDDLQSMAEALAKIEAARPKSSKKEQSETPGWVWAAVGLGTVGLLGVGWLAIRRRS